MAPEPTIAPEELVALRAVLAALPGIIDAFPKLTDNVKALETILENHKDYDLKAMGEEIQRIKASHDKWSENIRTWKGGLYVPGLEDMGGNKFSMLRAIRGVKYDKWEGGEHEKEVLYAVREKAGQIMGVDSDGGFFVPDQVIADVIPAIYARSVFIALDAADGSTRVSVMDGLVGNPVKIPKFKGGMIAHWVGEQDDFVEAASKVGNISMRPHKLGLLARITDEQLRFASFGFEQLFRNDMIRSTAEKLDETILYGKGTENQPRGLINFGFDEVLHYSFETRRVITAAPADAQGGEMDFDQIMDMQLAIEEGDVSINETYATITSPRGINRLKKLKISNFSAQTADRAYLVGAPMLSDSALQGIIGDFDKTTQIPSNLLPGASEGFPTTDTSPGDDNFTDVVAANFSEVIVGRWGGVEIADDKGEGLGFIRDETLIKLRLYVDIQVRHGEAVIVASDAKVRG